MFAPLSAAADVTPSLNRSSASAALACAFASRVRGSPHDEARQIKVPQKGAMP